MAPPPSRWRWITGEKTLREYQGQEKIFCFSSTCDEKLPIAKSLAEAGKLEEAMELLSGLEKQTRTGCDTYSTARVLVTIVQLCNYSGDFTQLDDRIQDLAKQAVAKMIAECQNNIA